MKIYLGGRGTGKTQRMIDEASKHSNSIIVVATYGMKISLEAKLQHEGRNHIRVITIDEVISEKTIGMRDYKFFFDDVQNCLCTLMHHSGIIGGMSINVEPVIDEVRSIGSFYDASLKTGDLYHSSVQKAIYEFIGLDCGHGFQRVPHIDHVKFNGPATIVFWKDGTKTVVKHDGKGRKDKRQAILYAFIRKIYGEGKPYHNILNEIERAIK